MARKRHYSHHRKSGEEHTKKLKKSSAKCKHLKAAIGKAHSKHNRGKALGHYVKVCGR